jgi:hypothetical protein
MDEKVGSDVRWRIERRARKLEMEINLRPASFAHPAEFFAQSDTNSKWARYEDPHLVSIVGVDRHPDEFVPVPAGVEKPRHVGDVGGYEQFGRTRRLMNAKGQNNRRIRGLEKTEMQTYSVASHFSLSPGRWCRQQPPTTLSIEQGQRSAP